MSFLGSPQSQAAVAADELSDHRSVTPCATKRQSKQAPAWFNEFMDGTRKTEQEKTDLRQTMQNEQLKISQERVAAIKDLTDTVKALVNKM